MRAAAVCAAALALSIVMTWPLASGFGRLGRTTTMDGLYSIWNISWVAHATISDPAGLLDANIFYPHRHALTFSEANILGGVVASPVWWLTGNPYAAHNAALMFAFCSTLIGTWLLVRRLSQNNGAAAVSAILFAFCPYFFSHSAHIQLLMAGGIPLAMLALHRLVDSPSPGRGAVLGLALAAQALACAYYGIFAGLMVGYGARVPGRIETSLGSQTVLGRARDRGRHFDRGRAPVLSAVPDDATRRRLPAFAR